MIVLRDFFKRRKLIAASVLIPTFGEARFARWAIESVRRQTIRNIEIFIICDGSPPQMVSYFENLTKEDTRIRVCCFPKAERTGEPYRDQIIKNEAHGRNIFYCSHDDLWFPSHIEELGNFLRRKPFTHSLHVRIKEDEFQEDIFIDSIFNADLAIATYREKMLDTTTPTNYFGLTYGAHTRKAYLQLKEGWTTTPPGIWTDLYMWRKFLKRFPTGSCTYKKITALNFPAFLRNEWSVQERDDELAYYYNKMLEPKFFEKVNRIVLQTIQTG